MQESGLVPETVQLAAGIVSAYVEKNSIRAMDLPDLIASVHASLAGLTSGGAVSPAAPLMPAVSVKKSITPDHLISMEDGKRYKSLKRHLNGRGMTPAEYRAKWSLPVDYPMTAPNYSKRRSELAKSIGLGRKPAEVVAAPVKKRAAKKAS